MRRPVLASVVATLIACGGDDGAADPGDGGLGTTAEAGAVPTVDLEETVTPAPVMITPESGGTIRSAAGLLEIVIPPGAVSEPIKISVVRLRGADVPADAMAGIAHTLEPRPPFWNQVGKAIWTIPSGVARSAFGATGMAWPLPYTSKQNIAVEPHGVLKYEARDGGGFQLTTYMPSPPGAVYLSTDHALVTTMVTNPKDTQAGGLEFTVMPATGSKMMWRAGRIGSISTNNWISAGSAVEPNATGGLSGHFRGKCSLSARTSAFDFELKAEFSVGLFNLEYVSYLGANLRCEQ